MRVGSRKLRIATSKKEMKSRKSKRYARKEQNKECMFKRRQIVWAIQLTGAVLSLTLILTVIWLTRVFVTMLNLAKRRSPSQALKIRMALLQAKNQSKNVPRSFHLQDKSMRQYLRVTLSQSTLRKDCKSRKIMRYLAHLKKNRSLLALINQRIWISHRFKNLLKKSLLI